MAGSAIEYNLLESFNVYWAVCQKLLALFSLLLTPLVYFLCCVATSQALEGAVTDILLMKVAYHRFDLP